MSRRLNLLNFYEIHPMTYGYLTKDLLPFAVKVIIDISFDVDDSLEQLVLL